jgi:hypothetical protein
MPAEFKVESVDLVAVLSDGFTSFVDRMYGTTVPVPLEDVIHGLFQFKLYNGLFVKRRLRRFLKDAAKRGWAHDDDLSIAAVHVP